MSRIVFADASQDNLPTMGRKLKKTDIKKLVVGYLAAIGMSCAPQTPLISKENSDRRPTTSPLGFIRTDGVYVCRDLKVIGSAGGLGFWPFESPATQLSEAEVLRFNASGMVREVSIIGSITDEQAISIFQKRPMNEWDCEGKYVADTGKVQFELTALSVDRVSYSHTPCVGIVYCGYIALTIHPEDDRCGYREYDFVKE